MEKNAAQDKYSDKLSEGQSAYLLEEIVDGTNKQLRAK